MRREISSSPWMTIFSIRRKRSETDQHHQRTGRCGCHHRKLRGKKARTDPRLGTKVSVWATSKMLGKDPDLQITSFRLIRRFLVEAMLQTNTYLPQIGNLLVLSSNGSSMYRCTMMREPTEKAVILSAAWSKICSTISLPTQPSAASGS